MNLYRVEYLRTPNPKEVKHVIAESKLDAISVSQPFYDSSNPMDYSEIKITLLCKENKIIVNR